MRLGGRVIRSPLPRVTFRFDGGVDAAAIADVLAIEEPIAVSGDVHQTRWHMAVAGSAVDDPYGRRFVAEDVVVGCWALVAQLDGRPPGEVPEVRAGASPAYDLRKRGAVVVSLAVERVTPQGRLTTAGHPAAVGLLDAARAQNPYARPGWGPAADCPFVVIEAGDSPVAGSALMVDRVASRAYASALVVDPGAVAPDVAAVDLIDVLEAVAIDNGADSLRLDGTSFLCAVPLGLAERGYTVGPPYDGDSDVEVWAERGLH